MADIASLIREARLPERTVRICLRSDLVGQYEALTRELAQAKAERKKADSLSDVNLTPITDQLTALEEDMQMATVDFVIRALPRPRFRALIAEHPPRKGDDGNVLPADVISGVNTVSYFEALVRACVVEPQLDDSTWNILLHEKLSDRQSQDLSDAAVDICRDKVDLPFS